MARRTEDEFDLSWLVRASSLAAIRGVTALDILCLERTSSRGSHDGVIFSERVVEIVQLSGSSMGRIFLIMCLFCVLRNSPSLHVNLLVLLHHSHSFI
jgi:hypothetical protein